MSDQLNRGDVWESVASAARRFNVHPNTIRNWIEKDMIQAVRVGGNVRIVPESIAAFEDRLRSGQEG